MNNQIEICTQNINLLLETIETILQQIGKDQLARADRENISNFETNYANFKGRIVKNQVDIEAAINSAKNAAIHAQGLGLGISQKSIYSDEVKNTAQLLLANATRFLNIVDSGEEFTAPYKTNIKKISLLEDNKNSETSFSEYEKQIIEIQTKLRSEIETFERDITKGNK